MTHVLYGVQNVAHASGQIFLVSQQVDLGKSVALSSHLKLDEAIEALGRAVADFCHEHRNDETPPSITASF